MPVPSVMHLWSEIGRGVLAVEPDLSIGLDFFFSFTILVLTCIFCVYICKTKLYFIFRRSMQNVCKVYL